MTVFIFVLGIIIGFYLFSYWLKRKLNKRQKEWDLKDIIDEK
jgi:hypothetical protein